MELVSKYCVIAACLLFCNTASALQTCKALMPSIADRYEGDCKNGKAHGNGKAEGLDQYSGEFRNGLPHGKGVYRWRNGDFYDGRWVKGRKDGAGGMAYKRTGKLDSVITGFWKDDTYVGKNEKAFIISNSSLAISNIEVTYTPSIQNEITIMLNSTFGNMPAPDGHLDKKTLTNIWVLKGSFFRQVDLFLTNKQSCYKLEHVTFPFRAKFRIDKQEVDIEFIEQGKYAFEIMLNN